MSVEIELPAEAAELATLDRALIRPGVQIIGTPRLREAFYTCLANVGGSLCVIELVARPAPATDASESAPTSPDCPEIDRKNAASAGGPA